MNSLMAGLARAAAEVFHFPDTIVEVGSFQVTGQEQVSDLRGLFPHRRYVGLDMRLGPGVDVVGNVEALPWPDRSIGSIIALSVFEHVERFWKGFAEVQRVLRPDGIVLVSVPFYFHIHEYPHDYWRFTPDGLRSLLGDLPTKIVGQHGPRKRPLRVWTVATGPDYPRITPEQHARFLDRVQAYARQPIPWQRRLSYRLGRILFGGGLFAPYLDAERCETQFHQAA